MPATMFESKRASERVLLSFDFSDSLDEGEPLAAGTETVTVRLVSGTDSTPSAVLLGAAAIEGAEVRQWVQGGVAGAAYELRVTVTTGGGQILSFDALLEIEAAPPVRSRLFERGVILPHLRTDRLVVAAQGAFPGIELSDDYVWGKLIAAEAQIERELRVFLTPVELIPEGTAQSVVDALTAGGVRWAWERNYDFLPEMFQYDRWGFIKLNHAPVISVSSIVFSYPSPVITQFEVPASWIRLDREYGTLNIIPNTAQFAVAIPSYFISILTAGRMIPQMIRIRYRAGLVNAAADYPDLVDLVQKIAVFNIISDSFLPASGSISADGLSQSFSYDMSKFSDALDARKAALMDALHGVRLVVV